LTSPRKKGGKKKEKGEGCGRTKPVREPEVRGREKGEEGGKRNVWKKAVRQLRTGNFAQKRGKKKERKEKSRVLQELNFGGIR